jgi:uncharacterized protein (DUF1800 family)
MTRWAASLAQLAPLAALAACGGGGADGNGSSTGALPAAFTNPPSDAVRSHVLDATSNTDSAVAAPLPTPTEVMDWAERNFSVFFPGHKPNLTSDPYTFRYYPETGNYVGVAGDLIYIYGPVSGNSPSPATVGTLAEIAPRVQASNFPLNSSQASRFLGQATLGVSSTDIDAVSRLGYDAWLTQELARAPSTSNWDYLISRGVADDAAARNSSRGSDSQIWQRLLSAPDSLRQRVTLAWSEIFVVAFDGINGPWKQFKLAGWWDLLAGQAFGNYRALLEGITLNPAMGQYLSSAGNQKGDTATGRQPDENYAREVMQLFSIGLYELNPDGTRKLDTNGNPIETYTQDTVTQLARVFTGWNITANPFDAPTEAARKPMLLNAGQHSPLSSVFLGVTVPANTSGTEALRITLDRLATHPNVGPFLGRQLIQRLVTSNPSPAYVGRVAAAFADNGTGVRGDLGFVVRAVLTDIEARDTTLATGSSYGKLREPMLRFIQWARSFKAATISTPTATTTDWNIGDLSDAGTRLGQSPLRSPTVFNFFRPGYTPAGTSVAAASLQAPEFQLADESANAGYLNMMQSAIPGGRFDLRPDYSTELALVGDPGALVDRVQLLLCASALSGSTRTTIVNAVASIAATTDAGKNNRVYAAILLVMASADFLIQK